MPQEVVDILSRYGGRREEIVPILQEVQEAVGYVPQEAMKQVADFLGIPASAVYGIVTFYSQFYLTPQGRHRIKVCQGTACHVRGGKRVLEALQDYLGIKPGETTDDHRFALERVACFGSCALAPVMVVDGRVHGRVTPRKATKLLEGLE